MNDDSTQRGSGIVDRGDFGIPCAALSDAARKILSARYLRRDEDGVQETPSQMFSRIAWAVADAEKKWWKPSNPSQLFTDARDAAGFVAYTAKQFFDMMANLRFLPNSPTLMNAGTEGGQLSACFVLPVEDTLESIYETLRQSALIHRTGGGTGFSFSRLREKNSHVGPLQGVASGPVAFMRLFDVSTSIVKQGGVRRGANMGILSIDHPDILEFIECKKAGGIENFNISVAVTDEFMNVLEKNGNWDLRSPITGKTTVEIPATELWKKLVRAAWETGDPGVVFIDRMNAANPTPTQGPYESTNPCGEQPLLPYESCNLGSVNLRAYIQGDDLNWDMLSQDVALAVRFLDNVIETNAYPFVDIHNVTHANRKIGLGVMGWADSLLEWEIPYDSEEALKKADEVMSRIAQLAVDASRELATERGRFPTFNESIFGLHGEQPRRNSTVTTIAPTGTISLIADVSGGIEPVYSFAHERVALDGQVLAFIHPTLKRALKKNPPDDADLEQILKTGSVQKSKSVSAKARKYMKSASEIEPEAHLKMQAAFQKHTENAVSKTINLPTEAPEAEIDRIYKTAWKLGCKGVTVFRDLSKQKQVLSRGIDSKKQAALIERVKRELSSDN